VAQTIRVVVGVGDESGLPEAEGKSQVIQTPRHLIREVDPMGAYPSGTKHAAAFTENLGELCPLDVLEDDVRPDEINRVAGDGSQRLQPFRQILRVTESQDLLPRRHLIQIRTVEPLCGQVGRHAPIGFDSRLGKRSDIDEVLGGCPEGGGDHGRRE